MILKKDQTQLRNSSIPCQAPKKSSTKLNNLNSITSNIPQNPKTPKSDKYLCSFCKQDIIKSEHIYNHLESNCNSFKTQKKFKPNYPKTITSILINSISLISKKESISNSFDCQQMSEDHPAKQIGQLSQKKESSKKLEYVKEIATEDLEIGLTPLKTNIFCVFSILIVDKLNVQRFYLAYRIKGNRINVIDLEKNSNSHILDGHSDSITEIKFVKFHSTNPMKPLLLSSSYDGYCILWNCLPNFSMYKKLNFGTWILSSCYCIIDKTDYIFLCGGFIKDTPIKAISVSEEKYEFHLDFDQQCNPLILESFSDKHNSFLFCGCDFELPVIFVFDYIKRILVHQIKMSSSITSIKPSQSSKGNVSLVACDYEGNVVQAEINESAVNTTGNFSTGGNIVDLIIWDDVYCLGCGDAKNNSVKTILRTKNRVGKAHQKLHTKPVLNLFQHIYPKVGLCLFTLGADKKIKVFKF